LAALLVAIVLSTSYVSSACGAACAVEDFHSGLNNQLHSAPFPVAEVTTCHHGQPSDGKAIQPNTSAVWVSESVACDDHDCDTAPAVVQSSDTLKSDGSSDAALSVVYQATRMGSEAGRISLRIPLIQNTSPPSLKTILRV